MENNKNVNVDEKAYYDEMHRIGFIVLGVAIIVFFALPLFICFYYDIMPKLADLLVAAGGLCAIFVPLGIAESFAEVPVMGSSYYISLVTGNVLNLKLPAAMNALKVADVRQGTPVADAVVGVSVAVSSLVTMIMLAVGVVLLTPLQPILESPVVSTAAGHVLPALFGCLFLGMISDDVGGGVVIHKRLLAAVGPFILCIILYLLSPDIYNVLQGLVMIVCIPLVYKISKVMYKKGIITVEMKSEETAKAIAEAAKELKEKENG